MTDAVSQEGLRYPVGRLRMPDRFDAAGRAERIAMIEGTPAALERGVKGWSEERLDTPYRDGGWTVRQLVHHVADSHMQAFTRFKLALTEQNPTIKPYDEAAWAELADSRMDPRLSLTLLDVLHRRWVVVLRAMTEAQFQLPLVHPEQGQRTLDQMLATYAWHGAHHVAHVTRLAERMGW